MGSGTERNDLPGGVLDLLILQALSRERLHGYGIAEYIERRSWMTCSPLALVNRVRFLQPDALKSNLSPSHYDGVITLFFLDCFNEEDCPLIVWKLADAFAPAGLWLLSDLAIPSKGCNDGTRKSGST